MRWTILRDLKGEYFQSGVKPPSFSKTIFCSFLDLLETERNRETLQFFALIFKPSSNLF